ncbi:hypothetical protein F4808DRAFT_437613 [Astrocystis sublimbata]|nr:hypothetical protein F4808DRAFT_437613 [Astrocystis sublimbata]
MVSPFGVLMPLPPVRHPSHLPLQVSFHPQPLPSNPSNPSNPPQHISNGNDIHPPRLPSQSQSPVLNGSAAAHSRHQVRVASPTPFGAMSSNLSDVDSDDDDAHDDNTNPSREPRKRRPYKKRRRLAQRPPLGAPAPSRQPVDQPFSKGPYLTLEDAIFSLQLHVFSSGYGVSQQRTVKEKSPSGRYNAEGEVIRKDFACDRGGKEFKSVSRGERKRATIKCGCPWKAAIRLLKREGDLWFVEILSADHNHPVTPADQMHTMASYRRWQRENNAGIRGAIARLARAAAMNPKDITQYLKGGAPDPDLDRIDKQILRALSMGEKELPGNDAEGGSVVFDTIARRPVIVLQGGEGGRPVPTYGNDNGHNPTTHAFDNPADTAATTTTTSATYQHTFLRSFTTTAADDGTSNGLPAPVVNDGGGGGGSGTSDMDAIRQQLEYPAIGQH